MMAGFLIGLLFASHAVVFVGGVLLGCSLVAQIDGPRLSESWRKAQAQK